MLTVYKQVKSKIGKKIRVWWTGSTWSPQKTNAYKYDGKTAKSTAKRHMREDGEQNYVLQDGSGIRLNR